MLEVTLNGKKDVSISRSLVLPKVEGFPSRTLESNFTVEFGVDLGTPAGKKLLTAFKKKFETEVKSAAQKQSDRVLKTYSIVAKILKDPDPKAGKSLLKEIEDNITSWYLFSKNGLKNQSVKILGDVAGQVSSEFADASKSGKLGIFNVKFNDNREAMWNAILGIVSGLASVSTGTGIPVGVAAIVKSAFSLADGVQKLGRDMEKANGASLTAISGSIEAGKKEAVLALNQIKNFKKTRSQLRSNIAGLTASSQKIETALAAARKKAKTAPAEAQKNLAELNKQLADTRTQIAKLEKAVVQIEDVEQSVQKAGVLLSQAQKTLLARTPKPKTQLTFTDNVAKRLSIVSNAVEKILKLAP